MDISAVNPQEAADLRLYSDPEGRELKASLASRYGVEPENVFLSNGSDDILNFAFLQKTAAELGCTRIATAHNADDNAETLLFNLCRGSGAAGLRGIPPVRGNIIRPLLCCTRAEIEVKSDGR